MGILRHQAETLVVGVVEHDLSVVGSTAETPGLRMTGRQRDGSPSAA
jgi:hypothetical protein